MSESKALIGRQTNDVREKRHCVQHTFSQGGEGTAQNLLNMSTRDSSIATQDVALDHQRANRLFRRPVRRFDVRIVKKRQDLFTMSDQMLLKLVIAWVRKLTFQQKVEPLFQSAACHG